MSKKPAKPVKHAQRQFDEKSKWVPMRNFTCGEMAERTKAWKLTQTKAWAKAFVLCHNKSAEHCAATQTIKHLNLDISIPSLDEVSLSTIINALKNLPSLVPFGSSTTAWTTAGFISGLAKIANAIYPYKDANAILCSYLLFARVYVFYVPAGTYDSDYMKYQDTEADYQMKYGSIVKMDKDSPIVQHPEWVLAERDLRLPIRSNTECHINVSLTRNLKPGDKIVLYFTLLVDNSMANQLGPNPSIGIFVHWNYSVKNN